MQNSINIGLQIHISHITFAWMVYTTLHIMMLPFDIADGVV